MFLSIVLLFFLYMFYALFIRLCLINLGLRYMKKYTYMWGREGGREGEHELFFRFIKLFNNAEECKKVLRKS